ncbi:GH3 domain-containing protein [Chelonoidis abingdonii]|uniref:GH3 domain-containing protein n=1 Tax=Chelonoidis abingdonii TaxID=106734 RepID=UPI0013F27ED0|nr:GH3 domain-containing protein [Chelonoidis abingdonii]
MLLAGLAVALALLLWAWHCRPGGTGSWWLILRHWLALRVLGWAAGWQRWHLEQESQDVRQSQERLLLRLLGAARTAEPGSAVFRARCPLAERGSNGGKTPAHLALPTGPWALLRSSCTADSPLQGPVLYLDVLSRVFPEALSPRGTARFSWARGCSLPAAAWALPTLYCAPEEAGTVPSHAAALYVQLLFALRERVLRVLEAGLVSELYDALAVLRADWEGLAQDLASGRLSPHLQLPEGTRRRLEQLLAPDAVRAAELRAECARGWDGIARRLWPRLQVVVVAEPSSEQLYGEALRELECQGLPFYCPFYSAAGALLGVNLWPEQPDSRYLLCPGWAFCEFLPAGPGAEGPPETVLLADVQEGQEYELVLTNQAGLSRCRVREVVKVAEFHNQCPVVRPVRRLSQTLSVRGEGVPEERFYRSLCHAVAMWPGARLVDYVCAESSLLGASSGVCAPHYQVFVELRGLRDLSEAQRYKLDQCLQEDFPVYKTFRLKGSIGPVRLHLVAAGAFRELRDAAGSPGPMARVLREKRLLHFIQSRVIS